MSRTALSVWVPDRSASLTDVALLGTALFLAWTHLSSGDPVVWQWSVAGFAVTALVVGPLPESAVGRRVGDLVHGLDGVVRSAVTVVGFLALVAAFVLAVPEPMGRSVATGGCLFIALALAAHLLSAVPLPS